MSFSKNILKYAQNLQHWSETGVKGEKKLRIALLGANVDIGLDHSHSVSFAMKSGSLSDIEKAIFEAIGDYIEKFKTVPSLRELDFFLRDTPKTPAWPVNFNGDFIQTTLEFFSQNANRHFETPVEWLKDRLRSNNTLKITEMMGDKILVEGPKQDAWAIEKNFDEWQEILRTTYQRPQLVLLYAINF